MRKNKGFTLTELVIAMGLLAFLATAILLFMTSLSKFSRGTSTNLRRIKQECDVREEVDNWFSVFDIEGAKIEFNLGNTILKATLSDGREFSVERTDIKYEDGGRLRFSYPINDKYEGTDGENVVEIEISEVKSLYFALKGVENEQFPGPHEEGAETTFPIFTHVNENAYLCKIVYQS